MSPDSDQSRQWPRLSAIPILKFPILKTPVLKWGVGKRGSLKVIESSPTPNVKSISMMGHVWELAYHGYAFEIWKRDRF